MSKSNNKKENYFSALSGFRRAVPIILAAAAAFITVCFVTDGTGALGAGIASVLLGLFSVGAYSIPVLLIIHAIFYAEDFARKRTVSRIIFSVITVFFIATIEYSIVFWGSEYVFDPVRFFSEQTAGGFLGSILAFVLVKLLGSIGVIILASTLFAIYIIFFFSGKNSSISRFLLAVLSAIVGLLAKIESLFVKMFGAAKRAKHEKIKKQSEKINAELLDDQFFASDGGMSEIKVAELGIHEELKTSEENLTLQDSVFHKSAAPTPAAERASESSAKPLSQRKAVNITFDIPDDTPAAKSTFPEFENQTQPTAVPSRKEFYGIDEPADSVFTKEFNPFDFIAAEKIAARASSKAQSASEGVRIEEVAEPVRASATGADEIEKARRQAEFERRKQQLKEMHEAEISAKESTAEFTARASESSYADLHSEQVEQVSPTAKTVEFNLESEQKIERSASPVATSSFTRTFDKQEHHIDDDQMAVHRISQIVASENPMYARSENLYTHTEIRYPKPTAEEKTDMGFSVPEFDTGNTQNYEPMPTPTVHEYESSAEELAGEKEFKEFDASFAAPASESAEEEEEVLKIERTILSPTPTPIDRAMEARDSRYTVIDEDIPLSENAASIEENDNANFVWSAAQDSQKSVPSAASNAESATIFSFGDESDDEDEEYGAEAFEQIPEEDAIVTEEIPPEEQNPEVIRQREMFPFLDREPTATEAGEKIEQGSSDITAQTEEIVAEYNESVATEDDELPPFEIDEPKRTAPTGLVAVDEPKKKEEKKEKKNTDYSKYIFPPIDFLGKDEAVTGEDVSIEIQENADKLIETLASFNVTASIKGVDRGPRITRYEVVPAKGVKVSNVMNLQDNIALELAANEIRMEAPIPGKSAIGIEIPNKRSSTVRLRDLLETEEFTSFRSKTSVCIGRDVAGQPVFGDIATMPHLLIAGATGMGKSVCINALMISMLYKARPDEVKFIMIDPKQVEFTMYNGIPHLLVPVVSDAKQAAGVLMWAVEEMERRYGLLNPLCVRNVDAYNDKVTKDPSLGEPLSRIVIVIDEFADLMLQVRDPVENLVMRIAQKARAAGIHLIIGTQRPTANVITGTIKANIPSRISCKVASNVDSRTVLDASGAEKLLNKGDMLYAFAGAIKPLRVQGAFVSDGEVEAVMEHLKSFSDGDNYDSNVMEEIERAAQKCSKKSGGSDYDDGDEGSSGEGYLNDRQFLDAVEVAVNTGKISTSLIQRKLSIGYGKAAKFIDIMEDMGIVGEQNGQRPREVKITPDEWREKLARATLD